jgi:hypothetical protein
MNTTGEDFCIFSYDETKKELKVTKGIEEINMFVQNIYYVVLITETGKIVKKYSSSSSSSSSLD